MAYCGDYGSIFTTMAEKQTGLCPVCKCRDMDKIEGFKYWFPKRPKTTRNQT